MGKLTAQDVITEFRSQLFFAIIATPAEIKLAVRELIRQGHLDPVVDMRDNLVRLKTSKIDGKEATVGQVLGLRVGAIADKLTEVIDEQG